MIDVVPVGADDFGLLDELFTEGDDAAGCWCMWFIDPVRTFHERGDAGNREALASLAAEATHPIGLVASLDGAPIGWCAVGPRDRYARAVKTPTLRGHVRETPGGDTWFVPCFFVKSPHRGEGVAGKLLDAAVDLARASGARSIEGFPLAGPERRSRGHDLEVGMEALFAGRGFDVVDRPSANRVVMRRELT